MRPLALLLLAATSHHLPAANPAPLFDGKTLAGFTICNGYAPYRVIGGEIVGTTAEGSPNSFLCTERGYGDFILEYETKTDPRLNSGVQIRAHRYDRETEVITENQGKQKRTQPAGRVYGYQVETATTASGSSGSIYDEARRGWIAHMQGIEPCHAAFQDNQWNRYRIEARADRIRTWVNGAPCVDMIDPLDLEGFIGLQVHAFKGDSPAEVRWRNLTIADLGRHAWQPLTPASVLTVKGRKQLASKLAETTIKLRYQLPSGRATLLWGKGRVDLAPTNGGWTELAVSAHDGRLVVHRNGEKIRDEKLDLTPWKGNLVLETGSPAEARVTDILVLRKAP